MTTTQNELLNVFRSNVAAIKAELDRTANRTRRSDDCVYVWPSHWLAVKFDRTNCRAVGITFATMVSARAKPLVFTNGKGERAILMTYEQALCRAYVHANTILADFEAALT